MWLQFLVLLCGLRAAGITVAGDFWTRLTVPASGSFSFFSFHFSFLCFSSFGRAMLRTLVRSREVGLIETVGFGVLVGSWAFAL